MLLPHLNCGSFKFGMAVGIVRAAAQCMLTDLQPCQPTKELMVKCGKEHVVAGHQTNVIHKVLALE